MNAPLRVPTSTRTRLIASASPSAPWIGMRPGADYASPRGHPGLPGGFATRIASLIGCFLSCHPTTRGLANRESCRHVPSADPQAGPDIDSDARPLASLGYVPASAEQTASSSILRNASNVAGAVFGAIWALTETVTD